MATNRFYRAGEHCNFDRKQRYVDLYVDGKPTCTQHETLIMPADKADEVARVLNATLGYSDDR